MGYKKFAFINAKRLKELELELHTHADSDALTVFIKDPNNPEQYWYRTLEVKSNNGHSESNDFNVVVKSMHEFDSIPCPENHLKIALRHAKSYREDAFKDGVGFALGVASYNGEEQFSLEQIINLVGAKYIRMRQAYIKNPN